VSGTWTGTGGGGLEGEQKEKKSNLLGKKSSMDAEGDFNQHPPPQKDRVVPV